MRAGKATDEVSGNFEHRGAVMQEARFVIEDVAPNVSRYDHRLMDYNNDPTTSFADIQKIFRQLEDRISRELKEPAVNGSTPATHAAPVCGVPVAIEDEFGS